MLAVSCGAQVLAHRGHCAATCLLCCVARSARLHSFLRMCRARWLFASPLRLAGQRRLVVQIGSVWLRFVRCGRWVYSLTFIASRLVDTFGSFPLCVAWQAWAAVASACVPCSSVVRAARAASDLAASGWASRLVSDLALVSQACKLARSRPARIRSI